MGTSQLSDGVKYIQWKADSQFLLWQLLFHAIILPQNILHVNYCKTSTACGRRAIHPHL